MQKILPKDLLTAEEMANKSIIMFLRDKPNKKQAINYNFEGLRSMPIAYRLYLWLVNNKFQPILVWLDEGSTALARNKYTDISDRILSAKKFISLEPDSLIYDSIIVVNPGPYDYELTEQLSESCTVSQIMLNGKLEDSAVGIGSVARERRKGFISSWENSFWLQPLDKGAIFHAYPQNWQLFSNDISGYSFLKEFPNRPNNEQIFESMEIL